MSKNGFSKRQLSMKLGCNREFIGDMIDLGVLEYIPDPSSPLRKRISSASVENLREGESIILFVENAEVICDK